MLEDSLQFCRPLVSALLVGINSRFKDLLGMDLSDAVVKEAVLAAVSHPQFKLKWVPPERRVEVTQCFVDAVVRIATASPLQQDEQQAQSASDDDYGYNESSSAQSSGIISGSNGAAESHRKKAMSYLADSAHEMTSLLSADSLTKTFIRYNTTLPSSAPVERLFSSAGLIETPRRNRLCDMMFEKLLMLKVNKLS
jgi:hypothetical protein